MNPMQLYPQDNVNVLPPADEIKFLLTLRLVLSQSVWAGRLKITEGFSKHKKNILEGPL